jgi:apolipoprotein N-acyltransferase
VYPSPFTMTTLHQKVSMYFLISDLKSNGLLLLPFETFNQTRCVCVLVPFCLSLFIFENLWVSHKFYQTPTYSHPFASYLSLSLSCGLCVVVREREREGCATLKIYIHFLFFCSCMIKYACLCLYGYVCILNLSTTLK